MTIRNTPAEAARRAGLKPDKIPKAPPKPQAEAAISLAIRKWLASISALPTRVNSGQVQMAGRWIQLADAGTSDMLVALSVRCGDTKLAVFLAIEVKKPGGKVSTKQQEFIEKVNRLGGIAFWADSVVSAKAQLAAALTERQLELWTK